MCGLVTVQDLLEASRRTALFTSIPYPSLAQLLAGPDDPPPARMMTPDLLPPPWPFPGTGYGGGLFGLVGHQGLRGTPRQALGIVCCEGIG